MTPPAEEHRPPPRSHPVLRVVESPASDEAPPAHALAAAPDHALLLSALDAAQRRSEDVAGRLALVRAELAGIRESLVGAVARDAAARRSQRRTRLLAALLGIVALAQAASVWVDIEGAGALAGEHADLLLALLLPAGSLLVVFAAAVALRLRWRRGRAVHEP